MLEYLRRNGQFIVMLMVWIASGMINSTLAIGVVSLSVLLLKYKNLYAEMISGFILILILSDSHQDYLKFAKDVKVIYLLLLAVFFLFDRKEFKINESFFLPFVPFLMWASFQIFRSPELMVAVQKTLSYGLLFLVGPAYIIKIFYEKGTIFVRDHVFLMSLMLLMGLILFIFAKSQVLVGDRYSGVMGNPNAIGLFCLLFFMLFQCSQIKFPGLFSRNEQIFVYILITISVLLSGSRNSLLSIALFLFFIKFYKISPVIGTAMVIAVAIIYQMVVSNLTEILSALGLAEALRADTLESGSGRIVAWAWAWKHINANLNNFIFGNGFGFDEYFYAASMNILSKLGHVGGVHNSFLALWINTGIVGLILWLFAFFRTIIKAIPKSYAAIPFLYAVLFSATFEAWLMGSLNPYTITFLFTVSLLYVNANSFADRKQDPTFSENESPPVLK